MLSPLLRTSRMTEDARDVLHGKEEIFVSLLNIGVAISIIGGRGHIRIFMFTRRKKWSIFKRS